MAITDRLFDDLRTKLPGALDGMIKLELWNTLDDLCREAKVWREAVPVTLVVGEIEYQINPTGAEIIEVRRLAHNTLDAGGAYFERGTLILQNPPLASDIAEKLLAVSVLTPSLDAADPEAFIPVDMWSTYYACIKAGVLGRMLGQPAKPYSNPALAAFHLRDYNRMKYTARHTAETGGVAGAQAWRFPGFAAGTGRGARRI